MGNCCKVKEQQVSGPSTHVKSVAKYIHYKARSASNSIICYDADRQAFWIKELSLPLSFQAGSLTARIGQNEIMFVGGEPDGKLAMIIDLTTATGTKLPSPPINLAYGNLLPFQKSVYVIGALENSEEGYGSPAKCLMYSLQHSNWSLIPPMPEEIAIPGCFLIHSTLYVIGGFKNYPHQPVPNNEVFVYYIDSNHWARSEIRSPISNGLSQCAVLTESAIMIIGGHDPEENCEESKAAYLFNGKEFRELPPLPSIGQLKFTEPPLVTQNEVLIFSEDEILFKFSLSEQAWSYVDAEEKLSAPLNNSVVYPKRKDNEFIYHYDQKHCEILEYEIPNSSLKTTGPTSFIEFFKYPGICILKDGRVMFAGGIKEEDQSLTDSSWVFEPVSKTRSKLKPLPHVQFGVRLVCIERLVYGIAGYSKKQTEEGAKTQSYNSVYSLDTDTWEELPEMEFSTLLPAVCTLSQRIYCFGGKAELQENVTGGYLIQMYTIGNRAWRTLSVEYPLGVSCLAAVTLPNSKIMCFGGIFELGEQTLNCYTFDGDSFERIEDLKIAEENNKESTLFLDPVVVKDESVYAFSKNGHLYKYSISEKIWEILIPKPVSNQV
jgi:N-acetylneuraminic acid mutarotase